MADVFHSFVDKEQRLVAGVAMTTETCQAAQQHHELAATSCIAMGRLLTATALAGFMQRRGPISLQVLSEGYLGKLFADVNPEGHLRGYLNNPTIAVSRPGGTHPGRRSIASAVGRGILSVVRRGEDSEFAQSAVDLANGEIDEDVESFFETSDQVPTALVCDVLLDDTARVSRAGGMMVQALPGAGPGVIDALRGDVRDGFARLLDRDGTDPVAIIRELLPGAAVAEVPVPLVWRCRCSYERAAAGLRMLPPTDLAQMVDSKEPAEVRCDFCNQAYVISPAEVEEVFLATVTGRG